MKNCMLTPYVYICHSENAHGHILSISPCRNYFSSRLIEIIKINLLREKSWKLVTKLILHIYFTSIMLRTRNHDIIFEVI